MPEHNTDCDVNDTNPEGIKKPCNCGSGSFVAPVAAQPRTLDPLVLEMVGLLDGHKLSDRARLLIEMAIDAQMGKEIDLSRIKPKG